LSDDPEGTAKEGKEYVKQGYRAVKYGWGKTRERAFGMKPDKDEEMIRTIREVLGPDIRIMVDVGRFVNLTPAQAGACPTIHRPTSLGSLGSIL
jgi:L-alanine-DL-glutamate epimerase-like enolase superfamily enzyme